jgi:putative ABC transport system permease protein
MGNVLLLAWLYLTRHKGKSIILTVCLSAALALPLTVHWLVRLLESEMIGRAAATPLVIGPQGSRFDLVLHALYFHTAAPGTLRAGEQRTIESSAHARAIPLFIRYTARGYPIVGTTLEYFNFRGLKVAEGHMLTTLGDCVVGWQAARQLQLRPGDRLLSDPANLFDLGGSYPLNMRVVGILQQAHSPDDHAVFVDLKTAWVIDGIGHGHDDLASGYREAILQQDPQHVVGSAAVYTFTQITPQNIGAFHFHGDPDAWPLTALIALPHDARARALLLGRYVADDAGYQALRPELVIDELLGMVIQLKRFFDVHHLFVLAITSLFVVLVMLLSLRLRRREMDTMFHIGCSRWMIVRLQAAELLIILALSAAIAVAGSWLVVQSARTWIRTLSS